MIHDLKSLCQEFQKCPFCTSPIQRKILNGAKQEIMATFDLDNNIIVKNKFSKQVEVYLIFKCNNVNCISDFNIKSEIFSLHSNKQKIDSIHLKLSYFKIVLNDSLVIINNDYSKNISVLAFPVAKDYNYFANDNKLIKTALINFDFNNPDKIPNKIKTVLMFA